MTPPPRGFCLESGTFGTFGVDVRASFTLSIKYNFKVRKVTKRKKARMCKNIGVSLCTFALTATCVAATLLCGASRPLSYLAIFTFTFALMQISDALLWWSIEKNHRTLNAVLSRVLIPLILIAELLVSYYGARYYLNYRSTTFEICLWLYILTFTALWTISCSETVTTSDGYLRWCNMKLHVLLSALFLIFLLGPIVLAYPRTWLKYVVTVTLIATFLINVGHEAFGTRWCWSSNIIAIALFLSCFFLRKI